MSFNFLKIAVAAIAISCTYCVNIAAQQPGKAETHLRSEKIVINRFEWALDKASGIAQASITITNKSRLEIRSVTALFTGQGKHGIMLQSAGVRTIRRRSTPTNILPGETKTVVIEKAFKNSQLETLKLLQMDIEYVNNSIEIIK